MTGERHTALGEIIYTQRRQRQWTQQQVATRVACSVSTISKLEKGTRRPDLGLARALDHVLGTDETIRSLLQGSRSPQTPAQLPAAPELVGRDAALEHLSRYLKTPSAPVVIEGMAGVGKTALAVHWAHTRAESYPDGVLYAPLHGHRADRTPTSTADVLGDLLGDLGIENLPETTNARARLWRSVTHSKRLLLVLDDAADAEQIYPLLPGGAETGVLITSRRRLSDLTLGRGARRMPLRPLETDAATRMLSHLTDISAPGDVSMLEHIATRGCDAVPLALRAAAEIINDHPGHTVDDLAEHFTGPRHLQILNTAALDSASGLWHVLASSSARLEPLATTVLHMIGTTDTAIITADEVPEYLGISVEEAEFALATLLAESLLLPGVEGCYCPRLVRSYARELPAPVPQQSTQNRGRALRVVAEAPDPAPVLAGVAP